MKRGAVLGFALFLILVQGSLGQLLDYTTEGDGFIVIESPVESKVDEIFSIKAAYYFTNQLIQNVSISLLHDTKIIHSSHFFADDESTSFSASMKETHKAVYTYTLQVQETNFLDETAITLIPVKVSIVSDVFADDNVTIHKGIDVEDSATSFDDLGVYEPPSLKKQIKYSVQKKSISHVDCHVDDDIVIFLNAEGFKGEAECVIKGEYQGMTIRYTYILFVGTKDEIRDWGKDVQINPEPNIITRKHITNTDTVFNDPNQGIRIDISTDPDSIYEDETVRVIISVQADNPNIKGIQRIDLLDLTKAIECNNENTCTLEFEQTFDRAGLQSFPVYVFFSLIGEYETAEIQGPWNSAVEGKEDLRISNDAANIVVFAKVPDLDIPVAGAITSFITEDDIGGAEGILKEYYKKKRVSYNLQDEINKAKSLSTHIVVEKEYWPITVINTRGETEQHTKFRITIMPKKASLLDYLFGVRKIEKVKVFEYIPKENAVDLGHIRFDVPNYEIIAEDPLVVWHFETLFQEEEITYQIDKQSDNPGTTLVTGEAKRGFPNIILALILIPIIAVIVIYFDRFKKSPGEEITDIINKPPDYGELEDHDDANIEETGVQTIGDFDSLIESIENYIVTRLKKGEPKEHIKQELIKSNWPADIIDKLIEKNS